MNLYIVVIFFSPNLFGSIYVNLTHRGNYTPSDAKLIKEETNLLKALGKNQVMPIFRKKKKNSTFFQVWPLCLERSQNCQRILMNNGDINAILN